MQDHGEMTPEDAERAKALWFRAHAQSLVNAELMTQLAVVPHKQIINRLLEPFMYTTVIVTSCEWENFFRQRDSAKAAPEMEVLAKAMRVCLKESDPCVLGRGEWHLPYIKEHEFSEFPETQLLRMSAARCARVSYLTHDKKVPTYSDDADLFAKLVVREYFEMDDDDPEHWSPLEHQATPDSIPHLGDSDWKSGQVNRFRGKEQWGNLIGWRQHRHMAPGLTIPAIHGILHK